MHSPSLNLALFVAATAGAGFAKAACAGGFMRSKSILIIDDDERGLRTLARFLSHDYAVTRSTSAQDAIGLIDAGHRYDAILCDMLLGDSSGREFYDRLLARSVEQAERVIFMSGMGPGDD